MEKIKLTNDEYGFLKNLIQNKDPQTQELLQLSEKSVSELKNICNKYFAKPLGSKDNDEVHSEGIDVDEWFTVLIDGDKCSYIIKNDKCVKDNEISVNSELSKAIIGKAPGETFVYESNGTKHYCRIVSVDNNDF